MIIVLGAGPAGLGVAQTLPDCTLFEATASAGGLCHSIEFDGALFDPGGHCFHTPHEPVRDLVFSALPMVEYTRDAQCLVNGELIPYPFQQHFEQLSDKNIVIDCQAGLFIAANDPQKSESNLESYLLSRFGEGVMNHFLRPYNEKLWRTPLAQLDVPWARDRVTDTKPKAGRALERNVRVGYPAEGGFGRIFTALAKNLPIQYSKRVQRIDPIQKRLYTTDGKVYMWDQLISTLSLLTLMSLIDPKPPGWDGYFERFPIRTAVRSLPLSLILVTFDRPPQLSCHRLYCASDELPAHKLTFNYLSSPWLQEHTRPAVMAETSQPLEPDNLKTLTRFLERHGAQIRQVAVVQVTDAYPIQRLSTARSVTVIRTQLLELGIHTVGRFGEWAYINSDEALHRGMELGKSLS